MILPKTRHLVRHWKSVPLLKLTQGSSLSIRSTLPQTTNILIQSGWRDDGQAELTQCFAKDDVEVRLCEMDVSFEADQRTSLGRNASHISILLHEARKPNAHLPANNGTLYGETEPSALTKPIEKFILDDGTVTTQLPEVIGSLRRVDYHDGIAHLTANDVEPAECSGINLVVQVPEKVNLNVSLSNGGGSIDVQGKLEGDCTLTTAKGHVNVTKLRGHSIHLTGTTIYAKDLLEAQNLVINTDGRLRAKQIHGRSVRVMVNKDLDSTDTLAVYDIDDEGSIVDVGSLFISGDGGATVLVQGTDYQPHRRAIRIKSHHGPLQVSTSGLQRPRERQSFHQDDGSLYPLVELGGVNGSCQVSIEGALAGVADDEIDWIACQCHVDSLSDDSVSLLSIDNGDIELTLDRKVESDLRLASLASDECRNEVAALLADEEDESLLETVLSNLHEGSNIRGNSNDIAIETTAYTSRRALKTKALSYESGWVDNKSNEPDSRFELKRQGSVGKIRIGAAADLALQGFSIDKTNESAFDGRPLFAALTSGRIHVETVSWIGAIARRYGLVEEGRELGRTSGRHGRRIVPHSTE